VPLVRYFTVRNEKNVLWLEVCMNETSAVQELESF
jgi:hypothetical protein